MKGIADYFFTQDANLACKVYKPYTLYKSTIRRLLIFNQILTMIPKISLTRSPTAKAPELRLPAVMYDDLMNHRVSMIVSLTAADYFSLGELASEIGISADDLMYCGYRILEGSRGDEDVMADCKNMAEARGD